MKYAILFLSLFLFCYSCERKSTEHFLENGLEDYRKVRTINESFIDGYGINKIGFFNLAKGKLQMIVRLNDEIKPEIINEYRIGIYAYSNNKYISYKINGLNWNTKPKLHIRGQNKYFIDTINIPSKRLDSLVFYLFDRDKYRKIIGNRIVFKNIAI